jgi:hypothetical protein
MQRTPRKRDAATLQRLLDKHGDLKLSEVLEKVCNPRAGRPPSWDAFMLNEVYLGIEAMKAAGVKSPRSQFAKFHKLSKDIVDARYRQGRKHLEPFFKFSEREIKGYTAQILRKHLADRPRLKAICDKAVPTKHPANR